MKVGEKKHHNAMTELLARVEHSFHMDDGSKAAACVDASMNNINWAHVARLYEERVK